MNKKQALFSENLYCSRGRKLSTEYVKSYDDKCYVENNAGHREVVENCYFTEDVKECFCFKGEFEWRDEGSGTLSWDVCISVDRVSQAKETLGVRSFLEKCFVSRRKLMHFMLPLRTGQKNLKASILKFQPILIVTAWEIPQFWRLDSHHRQWSLFLCIFLSVLAFCRSRIKPTL